MPKGMERTLVIIKPDGVQRGLVGAIVQRFEQKGLKLVGMKMAVIDDEVLDDHYSHHKDKAFFPDLKGFMRSAPSVLMIWQGLEVVEAVREMAGITKSRAAEAGSIRGDFGMSHQQNLIHASDSPENALGEIGRFFPDGEGVIDWERHVAPLVYSDDEAEPGEG